MESTLHLREEIHRNTETIFSCIEAFLKRLKRFVANERNLWGNYIERIVC